MLILLNQKILSHFPRFSRTKLFFLSNFPKTFILKNLNWRIYLARIKYHELVDLYKIKKSYEKNKAKIYYNLSKPFGKIAYREKKQYFIAIKELKFILKSYPRFGIAHFGLALSYGLLDMHKQEILFYKKAFNINPELKNLLPIKQIKIIKQRVDE